MSARRELGVSLAAAAASGWLAFWLWPVLGLPATGGPGDAPFPGSWRWFFAVCLPALFPAFTAARVLVLDGVNGVGRGAPPAAAARRLDRWSHLLLPGFLLVMAAWRPLGGWRWPLAVVFVTILVAKVLLVVVTLYRAAVAAETRGAREPPRLGIALFLVAFLLYGFLTPYVITAVSTAGDEQVYLLNVHSLYADGDVDIRNNVAAGDWRAFYWGRPARWDTSFVGFPLLLLPGYAAGKALLPAYPLAGRLGATLTVALLGAVLGLHAYRLCREVGASPPAALWAWVVVALTPPVVIASGHVYPELPAALAAVVGMRLALRLPARLGPGLLGVAGVVGLMVLLKDRYAALAVGVAVTAVLRLARRHVAGGLALVAAGLGGVLILVRLNESLPLFTHLGMPRYVVDTLLAWHVHVPYAMLGMVADQEFGLLYYAPQWTLAAIGGVLLARRRPDAVLALLGVAAFHLLVMAKYRWTQWDAGWTPPPRFVLAAAPLLAPLVAEAFDRCRGRLLAAANTLWSAWSGALVFALCLVPFWRYNDLDGRSTLLERAGDGLGLDLARFLPSLRAPQPWGWAALVAGAALLLLATRHFARRTGPADGWGLGQVGLAPGPAAALLVGVTVVWLAAAALVPTGAVQAEAMHHSAGIHFGSRHYEDILWVMTGAGELRERIVTWPGVTEITVAAGGFSTTGTAPRMTLVLAGRPVESWRLDTRPGGWRRAEYVARVPTRFGHPELALRFDALLDERRAGRMQHAYVDWIRLRRVAGSR